MYTTSTAFFEALYEGGVRACFVNLGSDHPSLLEAMVQAQNENSKLPKIYTVPNEMVALSMADGFARLTGRPQCVIVHVDVGTQGLGAAVHNASTGRVPVLIFAGLSPYTLEGELRGSRTEFIHWLQDVPDQKQILAQYCRFTGEIKTGRTIKQLVRRALQFATSDSKGPVYLYGAREVMDQEIEPYTLSDNTWHGVGPSALPESAAQIIAQALFSAKDPLLVTGYSGRNHKVPELLVQLATIIVGLRVQDTSGSEMCFPASHPAWLSTRYGGGTAVTTADVILVLDCDVPFINTQFAPKKDAQIFHVDVDPLKQLMPLFYIDAEGTWKADAFTAITQILACLKRHRDPSHDAPLPASHPLNRESNYVNFKAAIEDAAQLPSDGTLNAAYLCAELKKAAPEDTIWLIEALTNTQIVLDQIQATLPGSLLNCGGGGLGWSGGASLGVQLGSRISEGKDGEGKGKFVCAIVGDGTYMFSVPSSVYWVAARYNIPVLTVVLNNKGWNSPRKSLLLVHPDTPASQATNEELHISFAPTPDYAGIAYAAAGGQVWAGRASTAAELAVALQKAISCVKGGHAAVIDAQLGGSEGKFQGYPNDPSVGYRAGMAGGSQGTAGLA